MEELERYFYQFITYKTQNNVKLSDDAEKNLTQLNNLWKNNKDPSLVDLYKMKEYHPTISGDIIDNNNNDLENLWNIYRQCAQKERVNSMSNNFKVYDIIDIIPKNIHKGRKRK